MAFHAVASANSRAEKRELENRHDWNQNARRGSSDIGNLGNVRTRAGRNHRTGSFSSTVSKSGCAEWRCANTCRQNGLGATRWGFLRKQCLCGNGQRQSLVPRPALLAQPDEVIANSTCRLFAARLPGGAPLLPAKDFSIVISIIQ